MKEQLNYEKKEDVNLEEVIDFLKKIMPDREPWIERRGDQLIISGAMAFIRNIVDKSHGLFNEIESSPYFKNVKNEPGALVISADLKTPIDGISRIHFRIDKDM